MWQYSGIIGLKTNGLLYSKKKSKDNRKCTVVKDKKKQ